MGTKAGLANMSRGLFLFLLFDPAKTKGNQTGDTTFFSCWCLEGASRGVSVMGGWGGPLCFGWVESERRQIVWHILLFPHPEQFPGRLSP